MASGYTEYAAGWSYDESERGVTVNRVIHWDSDSPVDIGVELPNPGDVLREEDVNTYLAVPPGADFSGLYCRTRHWQCLAGCPKVIEWTIGYSNEPVDWNVFTKLGEDYIPSDINFLPITIEYGAETNLINPSTKAGSSGWTWESDGKDCDKPLPFKINTSTLRIVRYVRDDYFGNFSWAIQYLNGRLNDTQFPFGTSIGGGIGCWLFDSAPTEVFRNCYNEKWWRAEITCKYRMPDGIPLDGWQKVLKMNGEWDKPINNNPLRPWTPYMYGYGNFAALLDDTLMPQSSP